MGNGIDNTNNIDNDDEFLDMLDGDARHITIADLTSSEPINPNVDIDLAYARLLDQIDRTIDLSLLTAPAGGVSVIMVLERLFNTKLKNLDSMSKRQIELLKLTDVDTDETDEDGESVISSEEYVNGLREKNKLRNTKEFGLSAYGGNNDK